MTIEPLCLTLGALLTGCPWIAVVTGCVAGRGARRPGVYRVAPVLPLPERAHVKAVGDFAPGAALRVQVS